MSDRFPALGSAPAVRHRYYHPTIVSMRRITAIRLQRMQAEFPLSQQKQAAPLQVVHAEVV